MYNLPTTLTVGGTEYAIRSDYRAALDIFAALADPDLDEVNKAGELLEILYIDAEQVPFSCYQEAIKEGLKFLNGGNEEANQAKRPQLVDWEQDFKYIVAPVKRVIGQEVRAIEYLHWWTFISAYYEIGDCTFAQIVRIRSQKAKGKKLDKADEEWYKQNRDIVDLKPRRSKAEQEWIENALSKWL